MRLGGLVALQKKLHHSIERTQLSVRERSDAIGIKSGLVWSIECKVSLSDFKQDSKKSWRGQSRPVGNFRFYLVEEKILERIIPFLPKGYYLLSVNKHGKITEYFQMLKGYPPSGFDNEYCNVYGSFALLASEFRKAIEGAKSTQKVI